MNFIEPYIKVLSQDIDINGIWNHVADCARVCYQTESRNNESGKEFINRVILRRHSYTEIAKDKSLQEKLHLSVLEHGTIYLRIKNNDVNYLDVINFYTNNQFSVVNFGEIDENGISAVYITTNLRVLIENGRMNDIKFLTPCCYGHEQRFTISIITNIGGIRDINRHRRQSISEESTRYCLYTKDKFNNELTFAELPWLNYDKLQEHRKNDFEIYNNNCIQQQDTSDWIDIDWYLYALSITELVYSKLNELGWTAQQCSDVLNFSTKTQSIHTATRTEWKHFIRLRRDEVSGKTRPEVKYIATEIGKILNM